MAALTPILARLRSRLLSPVGWRLRAADRLAQASDDESATPGEAENHIPHVGRTQHKVEQLARSTLIAFGFVFAVVDLTGVFNWLPQRFIPDLTLFVLCTVSLYLVLDTRNARAVGRAIGNVETDISNIKAGYRGVVKVPERFDNDAFNKYISEARNEVAILNTWAPNLDKLKDSLKDALNKGVDVRVLLLHPYSEVVKLREEALRAAQNAEDSEDLEEGEADVKNEICNCLDILEGIYRSSLGCRRHLRIRLYNSLPAISVYKADERYLVGVFTHGRLAINSPQFEVEGRHTKVGEMAQHELDTLWKIGKEVDPGQWQCSLGNMQF